MKGSSASIGLGSLSLRSSQSLASIEANEVQLLQADLLRPEARAFLKSNKSLDKIVKSYVRKPMHLKATQVRSQPNLHMADRLMSPGGSRELDGSLLDYRMADPDPDHGSSMSMTLASEVNMVINSRPNSPAHRPNSGLPYVAKRNMKLNGTPRQPTSRRSPTRPLSPPVLSRTSSRSGSRSPARPSSPAKEQLRENLLPIWNEVTSHTNFPPSPTQTNIKGSLVPAHYVKESMIELVRKHDTQRRLRLKELLGGNKKKTLGDGEVVKGELAFEDSTTASTTPRKLASLAPSNFNGSFNGSFNDSFLFPEGSQDGTYVDGLNGVDLGGSRALASTSNMPSKKDLAMESLLSSTQRSKISSMIRIEDDYSAKWLRMKEKRDQRYEREIRRQARTEIMHTFKRVVLNTERNEFERTMMTIKDEQLHGSIESRDEIQQRRFKQKASLQNRLAGERAKKHKEANKIKTAMNITLQMAQAVKDHELSLKRAQHDEMLFQMDDSTSSIVEVPNELHQRVQSATSLKAYEAAKKEVREYQESTMSSRIAKIAKSRGDALDRVNSFGSTKININDFDGSQVFSDSISLHSGSLVDFTDSATVSILDEADSLALPPVVWQSSFAPPPGSSASRYSKGVGNSTVISNGTSRGTTRSSPSRKTYKRVSDSPEYKMRQRKEEQARQDKALEDQKYYQNKEKSRQFQQEIVDYEMHGPEEPPRFHPEWPKKFHQYSHAVDARKARKAAKARARAARRLRGSQDGSQDGSSQDDLLSVSLESQDSSEIVLPIKGQRKERPNLTISVR